MTDIEQKRTWVADMYPGPRWKKAVSRMPDSQVIAIYMREQNKPNDDAPNSKESNDDPTPF
jgi:hypothetical protein